ncbi:MAG: zinc ABC transporter substrate-binding protein [Candidatus Caldarchaeum sp.]|jgi:ABC-type Zn uptake system ZnuABC Zn-binding protein ZnuA
MIFPESRLLLAASIFVLALGLVSPHYMVPEAAEQRLALATTSIICDLTRNVVGELWDVECLVAPGQSPHTYEPTPEDMVKAAKAAVILYNGFAIDTWAVKLLSSQNMEKLHRVTEGLEPYLLKVPDGPYAGKEDPHMWMDVNLAIKYVERIRDIFIRQDPGNAETYRANAAAYIWELEALDKWIRETVSQLPQEKRVLVTQENAFQYFARAYGFRVGAYFYSIATEIEPSPIDMVQAVEKVKQLGVCVFFVESTLSSRLLDSLIRETGGRLAGPLYVDGVGPRGSGAETYVSMMKVNVETIVAELMKSC